MSYFPCKFGGGSGGDAVLTQFDNLEMAGTAIELPDLLVSPDTSYFIDFTTDTQAQATGIHTIFGIKNGYYRNFVGVTYESLRYQIGQNGNSTNISNTWDQLTGRHNFKYDGVGEVFFDGVSTYTYTPSNTNGDGYPIILGSADDPINYSKCWTGKLHRFTIKDESNDTLIRDYVPAGYVYNDTDIIATGLLDLVSGDFITYPSGTLSNDTPA